MLPRHLVVYPWDLDPLTMEQVLDHLHGEIGFTGLTLPCAVPAVEELRARAVEPRFFETQGGICFCSSVNERGGARLTPAQCHDVPAGMSKLIVKHCRKRKLALRLAVSVSRIGRLAWEHPWAVSHNVYGDWSRRSVCPLNANVQVFLEALLADLVERFTPEGVLLTEFEASWSEAMGHPLDDSLATDAGTRSLLSMCFCPSCQQAAGVAGVDLSAVKTIVTELLACGFDSAHTGMPDWQTLRAEHSELDAYCRWRATALEALWRRLSQAIPADLLLFRSSDPLAQSHQSNLDCSLPAGVVSELRSEDDLKALVCPDARKNVLHLSARSVARLAPDPLVAFMKQATETRWQGVQIGSYGQLSDALLEALRRAFRFASRTAGGA